MKRKQLKEKTALQKLSDFSESKVGEKVYTLLGERGIIINKFKDMVEVAISVGSSEYIPNDGITERRSKNSSTGLDIPIYFNQPVQVVPLAQSEGTKQ